MKNSKSHTIFLITSIIALIISTILVLITGSQTLTGGETFFHASSVVYDHTDTQAISQVQTAAGIQFLFLVMTEITLFITGILGLRVANQKTTKTLPCLLFAGASLIAWIIEIFAWSNLDTLMNKYDIYSSNSTEAIVIGILILVGILIAYTIGTLKHKKNIVTYQLYKSFIK